MKKLFTLLYMLMSLTNLSAQTNYTDKIVNPSFEQDFDGWEHKNMGRQGNDVFNIKNGSTYVEKWTGRGGAVGSGLVRQTLTNLPPGNYELSAAAQNIQENTPKAKQTGAWIFAGQEKTVVSIRDVYKVAFTYVSGSIDIGFEAIDASGNWIAVEGTDQTLNTQLDEIEAQGNATTSVSELAKLTTQAREAGMSFLCNVSASNIEQPFNLTYMIQNPAFNNDATTGWTSDKTPGYGANAAEFYETTFNFYQTLTDMPSGVYQLHANAFQRPGETSAVYNQYVAGNRNISTELYIGSTAQAVMHICDDKQPSPLYTGDGADKQLTDGTYVPITMNGAGKYFAKGLYDSSVTAEQETPNASLRIGIRGKKTNSYYWSIFDNFRLFFYGQNRTLLGIETIERQQPASNAVYDLSGHRLINTRLAKGLYIVNGKKYIK